MTFVGRFSLDGFPFLVGDILLSEEGHKTSQLDVPTVGNVSRILESKTGQDIPLGTPTSFTQKLYIIGGNLAIGWSGTSVYANSLINKLMEVGQRERFTRGTVIRCFGKQISNVMWEEGGIRVVGLIIESDKIHHFSMGNNVAKCSGGNFEYVALIGSGQDEAGRTIEQLKSALRYEVRGLDEASDAMCRCLFLTGSLLSEELRTGRPLLSQFGAAYEIVIPSDDGSFRKFEDVTYVFWFLEREPSIGWVVSLAQATKNSYVGEFLVVRTMPFKGKWKTGATPSVNVVTPVHNRNWIAPSTDWLHQLPSFNSMYTCHCVIGITEPHNNEFFFCANKNCDPMKFRDQKNGEVLVRADSREMECLQQLLRPHLDGDVFLRVPAKRES